MQTHRNKNSLSLMRSNLIGHAIFFHKWENSYRFYPPFGEVMRSNWERMFTTFPAFPKSLLQGLQTLIKWNNRGPRKRKYKKENSTECREIKFLNVLRPQFIQLVRLQIINKASKQCRSCGAVIHGGQFNICISSFNQSPNLATPEAESKVHKKVQKAKSSVSDSE